MCTKVHFHAFFVIWVGGTLVCGRGGGGDPVLTRGKDTVVQYMYSIHMYSICTLFKIIVGATRPKHNIIVGAARHLQHLLLFAANTIIFCFTSGKINNCSYKMAAH